LDTTWRLIRCDLLLGPRHTELKGKAIVACPARIVAVCLATTSGQAHQESRLTKQRGLRCLTVPFRASREIFIVLEEYDKI
jgi:hypothetical protein